MEKPLVGLNLTEVMDSILDQSGLVRPCPMCGHTGTPGLMDDGHNQRGPGDRRGRRGLRGKHKRPCAAMPECFVCNGRGHVLLNRICQCGGAANVWNDTAKLWHCGDEKCRNEAIWWKNLQLNRVNLSQTYNDDEDFKGFPY